MLLNEERLRELYAAGEITLGELERSLDIINRRREVPKKGPSARAAAPLTAEQKTRMLDAAAETRPAAAQSGSPATAPKCPTCDGPLRAVVEYGIPTAWCARCRAYVGPDPRVEAAEPTREPGATWIVGGIFGPGPGPFG